MATPEEVWAETIKAAGDRHAAVVLGQTWAKAGRIEAALTALAKALGPAVEASVKAALAETVVTVDVNVNDKSAG